MNMMRRKTRKFWRTNTHTHTYVHTPFVVVVAVMLRDFSRQKINNTSIEWLPLCAATICLLACLLF